MAQATESSSKGPQHLLRESTMEYLKKWIKEWTMEDLEMALLHIINDQKKFQQTDDTYFLEAYEQVEDAWPTRLAVCVDIYKHMLLSSS